MGVKNLSSVLRARVAPSTEERNGAPFKRKLEAFIKQTLNTTIILPGGAKKQAILEIHTRGGDSEPLHIYIVDGKRLTPFERRIKGYSLDLDGLFREVYGSCMKDLVFRSKPWSDLFETRVFTGDLYCVPVVLSAKHGFEYKKDE